VRGDQVDLDAGLAQRTENARLVRPGRAGADEDERGSQVRAVGTLEG
jgi:hypothetical protein